jgi:hypothetical protein
MTPQATTRVVAGLIAAALWLPLAASLLAPGGERVPAFALPALYTVPLTAVIAAPLVYFFRRNLSFIRCCIVGLGIGTVGALTFWSPYSNAALLSWGPTLVAAGLLSSVVFWVVGIWRNRGLTIAGGVRERR